MFYKNLQRYGDNIAIIEPEQGRHISYNMLEAMVEARAKTLGSKRKLLFIKAKNNLQTVVNYTAALRQHHVVHLCDHEDTKNLRALCETYAPHAIVENDEEIELLHNQPVAMHEDLAILLSTSGSTGSPKFVKLSRLNIQSNAESICEYLALSDRDNAFSHLKLHYSYGLSILHSHLQCGASITFTSRNVTDPEFWTQLQTSNATSFAGVPYTFEMLMHQHFDINQYPSLRYITQAGGKLEARLVKQFSEQTRIARVDFIVMYGQTEASPRMSYLPAELTAAFPGSIGKAIPSGEFLLLDEDGNKITKKDMPGELAYKGPNVMMGYATCAKDLSHKEDLEHLLTGDIACLTDNELYYLIGRSKRFVKLFGIRLNLDEIQSYIKLTYPQSLVTGNDHVIVIAIIQDDRDKASALIEHLSEKYSLPSHVFLVKYYSSFPLLSNGKYDYATILRDDSIVSKNQSFLAKIGHRIVEILELNDAKHPSILALFQKELSNPNITHRDCFNSLQVDSLSFVNIAIELEKTLGDSLPRDWQSQSISHLDSLYEHHQCKRC